MYPPRRLAPATTVHSSSQPSSRAWRLALLRPAGRLTAGRHRAPWREQSRTTGQGNTPCRRSRARRAATALQAGLMVVCWLKRLGQPPGPALACMGSTCSRAPGGRRRRPLHTPRAASAWAGRAHPSTSRGPPRRSWGCRRGLSPGRSVSRCAGGGVVVRGVPALSGAPLHPGWRQRAAWRAGPPHSS